MKKIISVIGAGGKTTLIHRLAEEYQRKGNKVLVTTTTHMFAEADTDLSCDAFSIQEKLQKEHYCMAGKRCPENPGKIQALPEHILRKLLPYADHILIESDGAKHHSLKYPLKAEPVIFPETTDVLLVLGVWEIGKPCGEVIFRFEEMQKAMPSEGILLPDENVTEKHIQIIQERYRQCLEKIRGTGELICLFSEKTREGLQFLTKDHRTFDPSVL